MVNLRHPNRFHRNYGFGIKYLLLLIAATVVLVIWAYQRLYFGESSNWLLIISVLLAVWGFIIVFNNIYRTWRRRR
jgi:F0F1-type ATP synthase assembly protein I